MKFEDIKIGMKFFLPKDFTCRFGDDVIFKKGTSVTVIDLEPTHKEIRITPSKDKRWCSVDNLIESKENKMSELISGKEALGSYMEVEVKLESHGDWVDLHKSIYSINSILKERVFMNGWHKLEFRLKPRAITINGVEVPAPFEPKIGDEYWILDVSDPNCYAHISKFENDGQDKNLIKLGVWRTEDEIRAVVKALRSIFK